MLSATKRRQRRAHRARVRHWATLPPMDVDDMLRGRAEPTWALARLGGELLPPFYVETPDGGVEPCTDVMRWSMMFGGSDRTIGKTAVQDVLVSTVFLGIASEHDQQGRPLVYESMAFDSEGEGAGSCRYATRAEAIAGHRAIVSELERELEAEAMEVATSGRPQPRAVWMPATPLRPLEPEVVRMRRDESDS